MRVGCDYECIACYEHDIYEDYRRCGEYQNLKRQARIEMKNREKFLRIHDLIDNCKHCPNKPRNRSVEAFKTYCKHCPCLIEAQRIGAMVGGK